MLLKKALQTTQLTEALENCNLLDLVINEPKIQLL